MFLKQLYKPAKFRFYDIYEIKFFDKISNLGVVIDVFF
jgi:hypothetical protein